ncbi:MAG: phosphoribosylaminoimidazolesuccinocarboxamide synthase [Planctomycetia bacterium]|nr:phosphoribosylaminoimidazolesuccinocarboxamide synthase [Planctomycetia bacterium]
MQRQVVLQTDIPDLAKRSGKVRDIFDLGENLLIVASDRISAFDCILPTGIPDKGRILTSLSLFWFDLLADTCANHLVTADVAEMGDAVKGREAELAGRTMLVRKADVLPIECVVRGYLAGSGWREYQATGTICGIRLPPGLRQSEQLPEPIFTPATKAESGHDENISFEQTAETVGADTAQRLRDMSLCIYKKAAEYARSLGIIISDTKFEWGRVGDGGIILVDEVLTPDSSRFWPMDDYEPGRDQESFDKQFVRNYLETLDWDKQPPAPPLPDDIVEKTRARYVEAYERLTGKKFES